MKNDLPPPPAHGASVEVLLAPHRPRWLLRLLAAGGLIGLGAVGAVLALPGDPLGLHRPLAHPSIVTPWPAPAAPARTVEPVGPQVAVAMPQQSQQVDGPVIEVAFVMDTTGSMGGLIRAAKQKAWTIVNELANAQPQPTIRLGLVAYRDHGDRYLTQVTPLTADLDAFYAQLDALDARGGGDAPEAVDAGLAAALDQLGWTPTVNWVDVWSGRLEGPLEGSQSVSQQGARLAFLMGDAPPHPQAVQRAHELVTSLTQAGVRLNAVQLGESMSSDVFQSLAAAGAGQFFQLAQRPETVTVEAPQDDQIVAIQQQIEATVLAYGAAEQQASTRRQWFGNRGLSKESYSSRASAQCKTGRTYAGDLLQALDDGSLDSVDDLTEAQLPEELRALKPSARRELVADYRAKRAALRAELTTLVAARDAWLRSGNTQPRDTFDRQVLDCLATQLAAAGFWFGC